MNTTPPKVKIDCAIVCDDVRREQNGKLIIIGVYGNDISVPSYPAALRLAVVLAGHSTGSGKIPMKLRILQDSDNYIEAEGRMVFDVAGTGIFPMGSTVINVSKDTIIDIQIRVGEGKFKSIRKLPIREKSA